MFHPKRSTTRPARRDTGFVLSQATFRSILQRERMRADRSGSSFSVLIFAAGPQAATRRGFGELVDCLQGRLRTTDVVGQWDDRRLATLLFDTDRHGAQALLDDFRRTCPAVLEQHAAAIRTYPAETLDVPDLPGNRDATVSKIPFTHPMPAWKRVIDLFLASTCLIVFTPLLAFAAVMIKLTSPGPILFCQQRAGLAGKPFSVYKLRTMYDGADDRQAELRKLSEQDGPAFKLRNDPRVTWVGKYLRKTCVDEFPQFWNVLRGEMSIVGPRPLPLHEAADCSNWQRRRLDVAPGMTCIWQVSGGMHVSFVEWMRMDLRYIRRRSLWQDFKLLVKTARAVLFHRASH